MKSPSRVFVGLVVVFAAAGEMLAGGDGFNVAGLGMGRTSVASARGIAAIGTNPANLALGDRDRTVTFTVPPPFGLSVRSDLLDYEIYNDYFTGVDDSTGARVSRTLSPGDKERILSLFPSGIAETYLDIDAKLFALTFHDSLVGSIGIALSDRVALNVDLPHDYAVFLLEGLDSLGSSYDFGGTNVRGWWLREYSVSYARGVPDLQFARNIVAGIGLKLIHGYGYVGTDHYNASFANQAERDGSGNITGYRLVGSSDFRLVRSGIDVFEGGDYTLFPSPAGTGFGVDLGVSAEFLPGVRGGLSVTDIGSITWSANTKERVGSGSVVITKPTAQEQQDSLEEAFKGNEREIGEFSSGLATSLRFGGSLQLDQTPWSPPWLSGTLLVTLEYHQGFNSVPGNTTRPRVALGIEYRPAEFLPLRTGMTVGGRERFSWGIGFGLDFASFALDVGTGNVGALLLTESFQQFSFGLGMRFRI